MLVLIVGPSGAGKDTLLAAAAPLLAEDPRFRFPRRVVTRPVEPDGEQHESVTEAEFTARRDAGGFALSWRAHGLLYGIPAGAAAEATAGLVVVVNVSRALVGEAAARFPLRVVEVTAAPDVLARRLAARGRQDAVDMARRLARGIDLPLPVGREVVTNDATVAQGARRLVAALLRAAEDVPAGPPPGMTTPPSSAPVSPGRK